MPKITAEVAGSRIHNFTVEADSPEEVLSIIAKLSGPAETLQTAQVGEQQQLDLEPVDNQPAEEKKEPEFNREAALKTLAERGVEVKKGTRDKTLMKMLEESEGKEPEATPKSEAKPETENQSKGTEYVSEDKVPQLNAKIGSMVPDQWKDSESMKNIINPMVMEALGRHADPDPETGAAMPTGLTRETVNAFFEDIESQIKAALEKAEQVKQESKEQDFFG